MYIYYHIFRFKNKNTFICIQKILYRIKYFFSILLLVQFCMIYYNVYITWVYIQDCISSFQNIVIDDKTDAKEYNLFKYNIPS